MFIIPKCQPASEIYGTVEIKQTTEDDSENSAELEQRLQFLGIKNSAIQEETDLKTKPDSNIYKEILIFIQDSATL